jgi:hypothetical protein
MQCQRRILPVRNLTTDIRDLIFRLLVAEFYDARGAAFGVRFADSFAGFRFRFRWRFAGGVDVGVGVPGAVVGGDDGVPDYGFGGWSGGVGGGVGGDYVEEELFRVPVEECGEVCIPSILC